MVAFPAQEKIKYGQAQEPDGCGVDEILEHSVLLNVAQLLVNHARSMAVAKHLEINLFIGKGIIQAN